MPGCIWARQFISAYPNSTPFAMHQESIRVPSTGTNRPRAKQRKAIGIQRLRILRGTLRTVGMKGSASGALVICSELNCVKHVKLVKPSNLGQF